jgi:group I intron endonuclease
MRTERIIGIYGILNKLNNKIYVGSTNNLARRKREHFNQLKNNNHENRYLQLSYNKYGKDNFTFVVLEDNVKIEQLTERELYWINLKDSLNRDKGYNLAIPDVLTHHKHSGETKEHIRKLGYFSNHPNNTELNYLQWKENLKNIADKKVPRREGQFIIIVLDKLTGQFIKEYATSGIAAKDLGYHNNKKIQRVLSNQQPSYKGLVFVYKDKYNPNKDYRVIENQSGLNRRQKLLQYSIDGELIKTWNTTIELQQEGYNLDTLYTAICRKKLYKDCYWKRV